MRTALRIVLLLALAAALLLGGPIFLPNTPLPDAWNPRVPLDLANPATPVTRFKMQRAFASGAACRAALATGAEFVQVPDRTEGTQCGIKDAVRLTSVGGAALRAVETRCQTALRLALWHRHGLAPDARATFGTDIAEILHQSSYNCRAIRGSTRISTHATAEAIDVRGFRLANGRTLTLVADWETEPFLRRAQSSACRWFVTVLGPDYNALHADHFHMQHTGWGTCR
ncbi:MAG: extensin family protein [Pseudomonadota bacterium]